MGTRILTNIKGTEGHKTPMKKMTVKKMMMTDLKNRAQSQTRDVIVLVMYILFYLLYIYDTWKGKLQI